MGEALVLLHPAGSYGEAEMVQVFNVWMRNIGRGHLDVPCAGEMAQWAKSFAM